jgi:hypothetical protein
MPPPLLYPLQATMNGNGLQLARGVASHCPMTKLSWSGTETSLNHDLADRGARSHLIRIVVSVHRSAATSQERRRYLAKSQSRGCRFERWGTRRRFSAEAPSVRQRPEKAERDDNPSR